MCDVVTSEIGCRGGFVGGKEIQQDCVSSGIDERWPAAFYDRTQRVISFRHEDFFSSSFPSCFSTSAHITWSRGAVSNEKEAVINGGEREREREESGIRGGRRGAAMHRAITIF